MGEEHKISSTKKKKRKDQHIEKEAVENDFEKNNGKKKKKKDKHDGNENDCSPSVDEKQPKSDKTKWKSKERNDKISIDSPENQLLVSDVSKMVTELFDEFKKEKGNSQKKKSKNKKKKKEKEKNQENDDGKLNKHKVFDDDDLTLNTVNEKDEKTVKKKKLSRCSKEEVELTEKTKDEVSTLCSDISNCIKKSKKKKEKSHLSDTEEACTDNLNTKSVDSGDDDRGRVKKKKKKSRGKDGQLDNVTSEVSLNGNGDINSVGDGDEGKTKKKKSKRKRAEIQPDTIVSDTNSVDCDEGHSKVKKKKKKKEQIVMENGKDAVISGNSTVDTSCDVNSPSGDDGSSSKKKKKNLKKTENENNTDINDASPVDKEKKEKEKKRMNKGSSVSGIDNVVCKEESKKRKSVCEKESDNDIKSPQDQVDPDTKCNSEKKKKSKKQTISEEENSMEPSTTDSVDLKHEDSSPKQSKKQIRKSEKTDENESEKPAEKKMKDEGSTIFQQSWNSPVFESEERQEKFKRLLGGKKSKDLSKCSNGVVNTEETAAKNIEEKSCSPSLSAGQWNGMMFENAERQSKFIRLLGGAKSSNEKKKGLFSSGNTTPKKGLFGSLTSKIGANGVGGGKAMGLDAAANLNQSLENDYNRALSRRLDGTGSCGIGFVKDPAEGKKFHINTNAVKSTKFSDED